MRTDVPRVEPNFVGVVAPDLTENEKIGPETGAEDIKSDEFDRKMCNFIDSHISFSTFYPLFA